MLIVGALVLLMHDDETHFNTNQFSELLTAESVQEAILILWAAV